MAQTINGVVVNNYIDDILENTKARKAASSASITTETVTTLQTNVETLQTNVETLQTNVEDLEENATTLMHYKGTVATEDKLPTSGNEVGDVYNVTDTGKNYAWDGSAWDELSGAMEVDVATADDAGIVKITDISDADDANACVGINGSDVLVVPTASTSQFGVVKLGTGTTMTSDNSGVVGVTESGELQARKARYGAYGVVKLGQTAQVELTESVAVAEDSSGHLVVPIENLTEAIGDASILRVNEENMVLAISNQDGDNELGEEGLYIGTYFSIDPDVGAGNILIGYAMAAGSGGGITAIGANSSVYGENNSSFGFSSRVTGTNSASFGAYGRVPESQTTKIVASTGTDSVVCGVRTVDDTAYFFVGTGSGNSSSSDSTYAESGYCIPVSKLESLFGYSYTVDSEGTVTVTAV